MTGRSSQGEATQGHRVKWGRAARGDRVGVPVERQEKEEQTVRTGRSAKYEATCEPKGWEGKRYENSLEISVAHWIMCAMILRVGCKLLQQLLHARVAKER